MGAADTEDMDVDENVVDNIKPLNTFTLEILRLIKDAQQQHGLRHGDYQRYRGYCSRRIRRLRKVLKIPQGDRRHYRRRDVTLTHLSVNSADIRLLQLPLIQAERAWAHAMQLRQEANTELRKRFHLIQRLRKACLHAMHLQELCESGRTDARTQLETQAYTAWMHGALHFELQLWKPAAENLKKAQTVYEKLSATLPEEEQIIYRQKVEELAPSLRYCAYNIGDKSAADDLLNVRGQGLMDNLDALMAQTRESRAGVLHEVEWRGRRVTVRPERVRLFLIALQDLDRGLEKAQDVQAKIELLENILMDCKDAISAIKEDIKSDPKLKAAQGAPLTGVQYLLSYLLYIRLVRTIERNRLLVKQAEDAMEKKVSLDGKKVRPHDLTRLYEIILQNVIELQQLPGFENDVNYQAETETIAKAYKTLRCFYIAQVLTISRRWREALALLERSTTYAKEALSLNLKDEELIAKLGQLQQKIEGCKFEVHANSILEDDDDNDDEVGGKNYRDKKPLSERLQDYQEDSTLLTKNCKVFKLPPDMEPIPCKPLFFDLACNFVEFPSLEDKIGSVDGKKSGSGITGLVKGFLGWGAAK